MFTPLLLLSYAEQDFWQAHSTITLETLDSGRSYQVVGAFYSQAYPKAETDVFRFYQCSDLRKPQAFADYVAQCGVHCLPWLPILRREGLWLWTYCEEE